MCSILALASGHHLPLPLLQSVPELMEISRARGPDSTNTVLLENRVMLGSNRLSIIDLTSNGQMPMKSESTDCWIVYNGELYNHAAIRKTLIAVGFRFRSTSDTEVVLNAYVHWGESFVERLNGIFAFVIFDQRSNQIVAARDRFGAKPMYYTHIDSVLTFSSDFRALRRIMPAHRRTLDPQAVTAYMRCRFIPGTKSILENISKLQPAEIRTWRLDGMRSTSRTYWRPHYRPGPVVASEFLEKLRHCIAMTSVAHVMPAVLLSGGLDSSIVAALMSEASNEAIKTFSCSLESKQPHRLTRPATNGSRVPYDKLTNAFVDESHYSRLVASACGTDHHVIHTGAVTLAFDDFLRMLDVLGEPLASTDAIGHFLLARALKGRTRLVLTGTGSDEILGGYQHMYFKGANHELHNIVDPQDFLHLFQNMDDGVIQPLDYLVPELRDDSYARILVRDTLQDFPTERHAHEALNQLAYFELGFGLPGWELDQADRLYMDQSIECRPAFLENEFVDYALTIPSKLKRGKAILKEAVRGLLPASIVRRQKYPSLGTPKTLYDQDWFQHGFRELCDHPLEIWHKPSIAALCQGDVRNSNFDVLYRMVYLQAWQTHVNGDCV